MLDVLKHLQHASALPGSARVLLAGDRAATEMVRGIGDDARDEDPREAERFVGDAREAGDDANTSEHDGWIADAPKPKGNHG